MDTSLLRCRAVIDLDALKHNFFKIKAAAEHKKIIAVVKANAYGHGVSHICPCLSEMGADMFAVSSLTEALEIRRFDRTTPILILGYTVEKAAKVLSENGIIQTVYSMDYAKTLSKQAQEQGCKIDCHIALDCGMGRIGFTCTKEGIDEAYNACQLPSLQVKGVFTHFPSADFDNDESGEKTRMQYEKFISSVNELEGRGITFEMKHAANSAAILSKEYTHLDAVRAGIILYGHAPSKALNGAFDLKPVMSLKTLVAQVKTIHKGDTVSYGMTFTAERDMKIATLAIGYADGYPRALAENAVFTINGYTARIVGRVCMDQLMVDVSHIPFVKRGDEAVAIGEEENSAEALADMMNTINYEVICGISHRVPRVYYKDGKEIDFVSYLEA
ncbi:MAG: alanine racemase [Clostridia bacterium]|nr:alanine racemase [Clostridia bacterium]